LIEAMPATFAAEMTNLRSYSGILRPRAMLLGLILIQRLIITVRRSRLSSEVRAMVPVLQSHFDFACLLWTY